MSISQADRGLTAGIGAALELVVGAGGSQLELGRSGRCFACDAVQRHTQAGQAIAGIGGLKADRHPGGSTPGVSNSQRQLPPLNGLSQDCT